jgi:hypothetical protein
VVQPFMAHHQKASLDLQRHELRDRRSPEKLSIVEPWTPDLCRQRHVSRQPGIHRWSVASGDGLGLSSRTIPRW